MKAPVPAPDRDELINLRTRGFNREQIADHFGVSLSRVKRWIKELEVPEPPDRMVKKVKIKHSEGELLDVDNGLSLIEKAQQILGSRMTEERHRGYLLDGRLVRVDILIRAAGLSLPEDR